MRLIDAEELGEKIEEEFDGICAYDVSPDEAVNDFQDIVDSCKTIDAAPVVHGHWETPEKQFPYWDWKCSACGCEEYRQRDSHGNYRRMNFCPNCGAKMDESEDSNNER